ncbi:MAG: DVU0259 family response regulator domain-containing protein [Thermodesulfobacteriota bacterium]
MAKKILIIDDDPVIVTYLETILKDNGYETLGASSSSEGLETIQHEKPDMITLDLQMPEEWGPRFYRKLTKNKNFKDIPVLVISGLSSITYSIPKAVGFLNKPFNPEELLRIVQNTIGNPDTEESR